MGRHKTAGNCASRDELVSKVWWFYRNTSNSMDILAKRFEVSTGVVADILGAPPPPDDGGPQKETRDPAAWTVKGVQVSLIPESQLVATAVALSAAIARARQMASESILPASSFQGVPAATPNPQALRRMSTHTLRQNICGLAEQFETIKDAFDRIDEVLATFN